ncbi:MAG: hypothetical protein OYH76_17490 [Defluviicoccus sp.]|nr:hypothetical protein [Defluviicoccus sp.]MDE0277691.1 hypothetical protein [Defluviicoccus sp.]
MEVMARDMALVAGVDPEAFQAYVAGTDAGPDLEGSWPVGGPQHRLLASLLREFILKTVIRTGQTA